MGKPRSCSGGQGCAHFSSVQPLSHIHLSATPWSAIHQASLSNINTQSLLTLMSIKSVMLSHPVVPFSFCLQPIQASGSFLMSQFFTLGGQSIRVSCSISPSKEYSRMISFKINWFDVLAVQGTLKSLLQHHSSKHQLFSTQLFMVQLSHPNMTTGKIIALTRWTFVDKVMSLFFNMLSGFVIAFLPRRNFMATVTICSDFGTQENKICHCFHCFLIYLP